MKHLKMTNISIEFPGVKALDSVDFKVHSGQVHALIGANGAGKSTLMKVLCGVYSHWTGSIEIDDEKVEIKSVKDAKKQGIEIVYQEVDTALVPELSVAENLLMNQIVLMKGSRINWKQIRKTAKSYLDKLNVNIDVRRKVSSLKLSEKQMILISRAVSQNCDFLVLDEPTAPLSDTETQELFKVVNNLKKQGMAVIFISHRLPEIFEICDSITILRNGKFIIEDEVKNITIEQIVNHMLGKKFTNAYSKKKSKIHDEFLIEVNDFTSDLLNGVTFSVKKGEVYGISGLVGAGKTELCKALFGKEKLHSGTVKVNGKNMKIKSPYNSVKAGLSLIPEERRKEGVLVHETVRNNLTLPSLSKYLKLGTFLSPKQEEVASLKQIKYLNIKTTSSQAFVKNLSGGNQQKVAIGKWLLNDSHVYVFDEPTKGIDVGAKVEVYELISGLAAEGKSIIYATCEFPEILGITDRVGVMYDGKIVKELITNETSEEELLLYSVGGTK